MLAKADIRRLCRLQEAPELVRCGLRFGEKSTHSSRTFMLGELETTLAAVPAGSPTTSYQVALVEENAADKRTVATRQVTLQRLRELYALDPAVPLFKALCSLWSQDEAGRPLLALITALARDPLLRGTSAVVLATPLGEELSRQELVAGVLSAADGRFNERVADKVARNIGSTWTQSGHLNGRVRKQRTRVAATPATLALSLLLGHWQGLRGGSLFDSFWCATLDGSPDALIGLAGEANRLGLIDLKRAGPVLDVRFGPWAGLKPS